MESFQEGGTSWEFMNAVDTSGWDGLVQSLDRSEEMLKNTWSLDEKAVADGAIAQIKEKGYMDWVQGYTGDILLAALNYDRETKEHGCKIEVFRNQT